MPPRRVDPTSDNLQPHITKGLETGYFDWQEIAFVDFQELIDLTRQKYLNSADLEH